MLYRIVEGRNIADLEKQVNTQIFHGWKPQGGVMLVPPTYVQAMVKEEKNG
jgi:hypothetical protein